MGKFKVQLARYLTNFMFGASYPYAGDTLPVPEQVAAPVEMKPVLQTGLQTEPSSPAGQPPTALAMTEIALQ